MCSSLLTNYNLKEQEGQSTLWERAKRVDYAGATIVASAVVCFMLATSWGGNTREWTDPVVVGCLFASVVLTILFCIVEAKIAQYPLMPWHIVSRRTPFACAACNLFGVMTSMATAFTMPLFLQVFVVTVWDAHRPNQII